MKRRSYLSSRESRSFLHLDLRNGREKFTFIQRSILLSFEKFVGWKWPRRGRGVAFVGRRSIENIGATPSRFLEGLGLSGEG